MQSTVEPPTNREALEPADLHDPVRFVVSEGVAGVLIAAARAAAVAMLWTPQSGPASRWGEDRSRSTRDHAAGPNREDDPDTSERRSTPIPPLSNVGPAGDRAHRANLTTGRFKKGTS